MDVGGWLRSLGLGQYEALFRASEIDADILPELTDLDLEKLGVPLGHRKRLLRAISGLTTAETSSAPASAGATPQDAAERRQLTVMFCDLGRPRGSRTRRVERLSLLRRAHDYHRDLRTRLPAAVVAYPVDRARQFMTMTPLSPSPNTAPTQRRYLTGSAHASPTATLDATFGRQNLEHRIPDHRADPIQSGQTQRPAGRLTVVLSRTHKSDQAAAANST